MVQPMSFAIEHLLFNIIFILSFGIYQVLPTEQVLSWLSYYSWVGIIV